MAKLPSEPEVRAAFRELFAENADDEDVGGWVGGWVVSLFRSPVSVLTPPIHPFTPSHPTPPNENKTQAMDLDRVQRALEEHLDVADLTARASVIEEELARWKEEAEKKSRGGACMRVGCRVDLCGRMGGRSSVCVLCVSTQSTAFWTSHPTNTT